MVCVFKHLYCSAQLSMSNTEKRYRNKIIIIIIISGAVPITSICCQEGVVFTSSSSVHSARHTRLSLICRVSRQWWVTNTRSNISTVRHSGEGRPFLFHTCVQ